MCKNLPTFIGLRPAPSTPTAFQKETVAAADKLCKFNKNSGVEVVEGIADPRQRRIEIPKSCRLWLPFFFTKLRLDGYQQISNRCIPFSVELEVPKSHFYKTISNQGLNSQTILKQSSDSFRTYDNLMTTGEFTERLGQS